MHLLFSTLWKTIEYYDQTVDLFFNRDLANPVFDAILPWTREAIVWAPLYLFLIVFAVQNFGWRGLAWIGGIILTFAISDQISSNFIKHYFQRLRPCNDPFFSSYVLMRLKTCSSGFSFTSSHAANHFAVASFIYFTGKNYFGKKLRWFFVWAGTIAYAQVYVGVHYPLDIFCGALVGFFIGYLSAGFFNRRINPTLG